MSIVLNSVIQEKLIFDDINSFKVLNGTNQNNILTIEKLIKIKIHTKGNELIL